MTPINCVRCLAECPRDPGRRGHLDDYLIDRCVQFAGDEAAAVLLLRQIIDEVVRFANGSSFTILLIKGVLKDYPEDEASRAARREHFERTGCWP